MCAGSMLDDSWSVEVHAQPYDIVGNYSTMSPRGCPPTGRTGSAGGGGWARPDEVRRPCSPREFGRLAVNLKYSDLCNRPYLGRSFKHTGRKQYSRPAAAAHWTVLL